MLLIIFVSSGRAKSFVLSVHCKKGFKKHCAKYISLPNRHPAHILNTALVYVQTEDTEHLRRQITFELNDVSNQKDATTFSFNNLFKSVQHVSGDKFVHPQEHFLTV